MIEAKQKQWCISHLLPCAMFITGDKCPSQETNVVNLNCKNSCKLLLCAAFHNFTAVAITLLGCLFFTQIWTSLSHVLATEMWVPVHLCYCSDLANLIFQMLQPLPPIRNSYFKHNLTMFCIGRRTVFYPHAINFNFSFGNQKLLRQSKQQQVTWPQPLSKSCAIS